MLMHNNYKFIASILNPFKYLIYGLFFVAIIWAIDVSLRPYILKIILDKIPTLSYSSSVSELAPLAGIYLSLSFLINILYRIYGYIWLKLKPELKSRMSETLVERMLNHSQNLFQENFTGGIANKIRDISDAIPELIKLGIDKFFANFLALIIAIITVFTISYKFALLLFAWMVIFIYGSNLIAKKAHSLAKVSTTVRSTTMGFIIDLLSNINNVKLFCSLTQEINILKKFNNKYKDSCQKRDWCFLKMHSFQGFSFIIYQIICFILLIYGFKKNSITSGDFVLLLTINISIVDILWPISEDVTLFSELYSQITQNLSIILSPIEIKDKENAFILNVSKGEIVFDRVDFRYKNSNLLFNNLSLKISPNEKVGLVGYSGGGKTSFVNLLLRLYEINSGSILIDGQDIVKCTQNSLRNSISMISQEPSLFHRTIIENIRYGKIDASDEEVFEAAKKAHAHEFIIELPNGYMSLVGERGLRLSGGQRQRIAIARAILKNSPILIFDEATSQLDSVTEKLIKDSLHFLMKKSTTIVIAHRLSTLLEMDRIIVFDKGKIVEDGKHEDLLNRDGLYKKLWDTQIAGFIPEQAT